MASKKKKAKKKTAPRKPAAKKHKKKSAKKSAKKPVKTGWAPKPVTITISRGSDGKYYTSADPVVHRSKRDLVCWQNDTDKLFTLNFYPGVWPFEAKEQSILVPAQGNTGWFIVRKKTNDNHEKVVCQYSADPALDGPPGDPSVESDY